MKKMNTYNGGVGGGGGKRLLTSWIIFGGWRLKKRYIDKRFYSINIYI